MPLYELRGQFYSAELISQLGDEEELHKSVSMHLAFYSVGSWPESTLKEAIAWHIERENGTGKASPIPMIDSQWVELMDSGIAPWPIKLETTYIEVPEDIAREKGWI
jgi:hypothetical protein